MVKAAENYGRAAANGEGTAEVKKDACLQQLPDYIRDRNK